MAIDSIPDGTTMICNAGYAVGHCKECRLIQTKLYALDGEFGWCISCLPKMINLRLALKHYRKTENPLLEVKGKTVVKEFED